MSKKKTKAVADAKPAAKPAAVPAGPGFWDATLLPFLERRSLLIAVVLILLAAGRIASTYWETGLTWDEPGHMACGLQYLADHVYKYEAQHPPLARVASALLPWLNGARPLHDPNQDHEGVRVMYQSGHPGTMLTQMRLGILPFFLLAAVCVYLWARRHFGPAAAALSTLMFTIAPPVLAHGGLATTDMPLAGSMTAAFFCLLLWAGQPTWPHAILLGCTTALAVVSKFTVLGFLPAAAVFALIAWAIVERPSVAGAVAAVKRRWPTFLLAVVSGALVIWAVYSFTFGRVKGWSFSLPAPSLFEGIDFALYHNQRGHAAYLLGEIRNTGWWYFFPVLLAIKTPLAWLALAVFGIGVALVRRRKVAYWMPIAFALGVLVPSMTSHVNIGLRHILPIYSGLAILAGIGLLRLIEKAPAKKWAAAAAIVLLVWAVGSGALQHPNYLAYFNEAAGDHPEHIVIDSDLDWGQDTIRLARRLKALHADHVSFTTLNLTPENLMSWPGFPATYPINPLKPIEGWTAVGPTLWVLREYGLGHKYPNLHPWFSYQQPQERVGSLFLYYVAPGSIPPELR
jgi:hypothetical protein